MIDKTRETALKILYKIEKETAYSNLAIKQALETNKNLDSRDISFLSELVYGVTTWKLTIDEIIKKYSKIKIKKISPWIMNTLRLGIYQIIWLDRVPKSAAVNESVNLAKRYGHAISSNFVNAILRKVTENDYEELKNIKDQEERLSKMYSMPEWLVKKLIEERQDINIVENICQELNKRPKLTVRRNNLKLDKEEFENELSKNEINFKNSEINSDFYIIEGNRNIEQLEPFKKGYLTVQDISAGLSAFYLEPKKGETILDACSAPGGKTTYLAELMENMGKIEAWDIHEHRTKLVAENAKRLGITIIDTKEKDATIYYEENYQKFDKILLDVPCLGIGVIKRKPDIKWQKNQEKIKEITKTQEQILETCSKYLKPGGTLIYSTCSILKEENQEIIKKFLEKNKDFKIEEISNEKKFTKNLQMLEILPNENQDGFFICKLKRV